MKNLITESEGCTEARHARYHGACPWCCDACNYDTHRCHFCGDDLRHDGSVIGSPPGTPNACYTDNP